MNVIDIEALASRFNLDHKELAIELFPGIKYPELALRRVFKKEAELNASQICKLAALLKIGVADVFNERAWEFEKKTSTHSNILVLSSNDYRAEIDTDSWLVNIYKNGSLFHESFIIHKFIKISEFVEVLNSIITKSEN